jgi:hypothetical protein
MGELHVRYVIRDSLLGLRDRKDPGRGHVQKFRARVDETPDKPGTGDAIDLGALARDPP